MFSVSTSTAMLGNMELKLETGKLARQANGAVLISLGETVLLCTAVVSKQKIPEESLAFTVNYCEKFYAAGKIPGGFIKREGKPTDKEILVSRLIDRSLRPVIKHIPHYEIQVTCTVLSYDGNNYTDIAAVIGASAAIRLAGIECEGTIAAVKIGYSNDKIVVFPHTNGIVKEKLDMFVSGTATHLTMVECSSDVPKREILDALKKAQNYISKITTVIDDLVNKDRAIRGIRHIEDHIETKSLEEIRTSILQSQYYQQFVDAIYIACKKERANQINKVKNLIQDEITTKLHDIEDFNKIFSNVKADIVRKKLLQDGIRIDGRTPEQIRNIECEIDILPKTHGSALFTRGETQVLSVVTVGTGQDVQVNDDITGVTSEKFMMHYNFPPYSVGEIGVVKAPSRREIGHGRLALRALLPVLPDMDEYPYVVRVVADVTESNGSSSMATVCASSLALMSAGIPMKKHAAGIAMGLIKSDDKYVILSDIIGEEDHLGDMDLKISGTADGNITALQMDIKIQGIDYAIIGEAIDRGVLGIKKIIECMSGTIAETNEVLRANVPKIFIMQIKKDDIRTLIGPAGKTVKEINSVCNVRIEIQDDGKVTIVAGTEEDIQSAIARINSLLSPIRIDDIYDVTVTKVVDFGVFVRLSNNSEGLLHISEITNNTHISNLNNILNEGDIIRVKMIGFDRNGRAKFSAKGVDGNAFLDVIKKTQEELSEGKNSTQQTSSKRKRFF